MTSEEVVKVPHKPTRKGSEYPDYYLFKGANYEELFHWAAQDDHDWNEKARTGNKRCFLDGKRVLLDNRIVIAVFDPEHKRVLIVHGDYLPPVAWSINWCNQRAFEHWEILHARTDTIEDALDELKIATRSYTHKRSNGGDWEEEKTLESYENLCKFLDVIPDTDAVVAHKDAKKAWEDRAEEWQKKRQAKEDAEEQRRAIAEEKSMEFLKAHAIEAGLISDTKSYSQNFKAISDYEWPDQIIADNRRFFHYYSKQIHYGYIQRLLGHDNVDAVWVENRYNRFLTSRGVTVQITDDLIKLIEMVIKATPKQREKFVDRHVGSFSIGGFTETTVRVGCHTFLLSDLPALVEEWKHPTPEDTEKIKQELLRMIEAERIAVNTHQEELQKLLTEAAKRGITVSLGSQEETKEN